MLQLFLQKFYGIRFDFGKKKNSKKFTDHVNHFRKDVQSLETKQQTAATTIQNYHRPIHKQLIEEET